MINTMTQHDFTEWFRTSETRKDQFSYNGLVALFEYIESYEIDTASKIEFDPIALCCEYTEYETGLECAKEYGYEEVVDLEPHGSVDLEEVAELEEEQALEWLRDNTQVIEFDGGIIIQNY